MTPSARQAKIADIIRQQKRVTVNDLAERLKISRETIRRDLTALAQTGEVQKFHGGAVLAATVGEGPFRERMGVNVGPKTLIAEKATQLVTSNETLLIDTGSTTVYFAEKLCAIPRLTVITNSAEIARIISLADNGSEAFLLGGKFSGCNRQTIGSFAISQMQFFRAHHAVLTIGALDAKSGIMDFSADETQVAKAMIAQAERLTVIADQSKFDRIASFQVCGLGQITNLVCDYPPQGKLLKALLEANVTILSVY
ncbi:DeoR/GlpR family DNA-binding transcription regulator [Desulfogranum japonicum]|uniref:DeoR/GlpR family DNA-binding transcription regulator n=1 Tax=Desulfogranum japonicum TaxID=231447 RepID=UPI0004080695|nr:DeoR/GlpR family DNA-binding transcription regulator [Desulfogranum japonicum]